MTLIGEMRFLERMQFFNGQRLFASDLQSLEQDNRERRWLHNASLHRPGVGSGYAVTGNKGDREVTITAGYAIDSAGREIILTGTHVEPVPPVADDDFGKPVFYDLTVSYPEDDALEDSELRDGICLPRGVIRLREEPVFCWVRLNADGQPRGKLKSQVEEGIKIRLARAEVFDCQLNNPISTAQRRNARPPSQPYLASGKFAPDPTWKIVPATAAAGPSSFGPGLEIQIDTSAAGFVTVPCYSVQIVGERYFNKDAEPVRVPFAEVFKNLHLDSFLLDGFIDVLNPDARSFTMRVLMPEMSAGALKINPADVFGPGVFTKTTFADLLKANGWKVTWLGVEQ